MDRRLEGWLATWRIPCPCTDPEEAADVLIYLVQFADVCGIDLLAEAYAKIERNDLASR